MTETRKKANQATMEKPATEAVTKLHLCANKECGSVIPEARIQALGYVPKYCRDCQQAVETKNGQAHGPIVTYKPPTKLKPRKAVDRLR